MATALVVAMLVAGCGADSSGGAGGAVTQPCSPNAQGDAALVAWCQTAVSVANARIGWLHWPISSTTVHPGSPCPPNADCAISLRTWTVVFTFWAGDPVMVVVTGDEGGVAAAADPEPVPTWMPLR